MRPPGKYKQPPGMAPGIYLGMSNDAYHADAAFSHSGMIHILESPLDYWEMSVLNPDRAPFKTKPNMSMGVWTETLLLEPDKFFRRYKVSGTDFAAKKEVIPSFEFKDVKRTVEMIRSVKEANDYFTGGIPQVSIFLIHPDTGVRIRVRVDYLRHFGGIDYKRVRFIHGSGLGRIINDYGYDLQDAVYRWAIAESKRLLRLGKIKVHSIHGEHDTAWFKAFMDDNRSLFTFAFQRSSPPFPFVIQSLDAEIQAQSQGMMLQAIDIYDYHIRKYGSNRWPAGRILQQPFSIYHLPKRYLDRGVHQYD